MQIKIRFLELLLCLTLFSLPSCSKNDLENIFYWDQTGCADPWRASANNGDQEKIASAVKDYLKNNGIKPRDIEFRDNRKTGQQFCLACHCTTGLRILVVVRDKDIDLIMALGFQQY